MYNIQQICEFLGVEAPKGIAEKYISEISTNSRDIKPGALFVAIKGERFDADDFVESALENGAVAAVTTRKSEDNRFITVENGLAAYGKIAHCHRMRSKARIIAITGSAGKSTTKEITAHILSQKYKTLSTEGSLNNEIGVPKTLLSLDDSHEVAVIEMGMSARGEISRLSRMANPEIGVITNVGTAHIEKLGSREEIAKAKFEIIDGMEKGSTVIFPSGEPVIYDRLATICGDYKLFSFGFDDFCDLRASMTGENTVFVNLLGKLTLDITGKHLVSDAMAAAAACLTFGLSREEIRTGLESYRKKMMIREKEYEVRGVTVIDDSFNANLESMTAALEGLRAKRTRGRKFAVLGCMLEVGEKWRLQFHRQVGKLAEDVADVVITYGDGKPDADARFFNAGIIATSLEEIDKILRKETWPGDIVLFKASHRLHFDKAVELFLKK